MLNLINADLRKFSQTKLVYIILGILSFFAILNPFLFLTIDFGELNLPEPTAYQLFLDSFNPNNNAGLLIGVLACILISQEFSHGTIRNKVIAGHKRWHIYFSLTLATTIVSLFLYVINAIFTGVTAFIVLDYGRDWNWNEFFHLLEITSISMIIYTVFIMVAIFITMLIRSTGLSIVVYFFFDLAIMATWATTEIPLRNHALLNEIFSYTPLFQQYMIMYGEYSRKLALKALIMSPIYYLIFTVLGMYFFKRRDLK